MAKRNVTLRDKYKSTTALYPKIDAKSLTPTAIEEITKITEVVVEEQVVPNPTPTGTPVDLEYITINGIEYHIAGGTLVIANPTLAGTEADLTGIQIGDVKYKVGSQGTHLYLHNIDFHKANKYYITLNIITDSSTALTLQTMFTWLYNNGFNTSTAPYLANGVALYGGNLYNVYGVGKDQNNYKHMIGRGDASFLNVWENIDISDATVNDNVIDLGIASGGGSGTQVQANWNETDTDSPAYIQNKPTIPSAQVQSNWNETDTDSLAYIQNKPTIPVISNKYQHFITVDFTLNVYTNAPYKAGSKCYMTFQIINGSSSQINSIGLLKAYFSQIGLTSISNRLLCVGYIKEINNSDQTHYYPAVYGMYYNTTSGYLVGTYVSEGSELNYETGSINIINDVVSQII